VCVLCVWGWDGCVGRIFVCLRKNGLFVLGGGVLRPRQDPRGCVLSLENCVNVFCINVCERFSC